VGGLTWFEYGWYWLGIGDFAAVLGAAVIWLCVAADIFVFHRTHDRRGRGVLLAGPMLAWLLFACRQAINTSQIDMAGGYSRYPAFLSCVVGSGLVGLLVGSVAFATDRFLAGPGPYAGPCRGVIRCTIAAILGWMVVWSAAFAHEMAG
jgi:hypothetical protein